MNLHLAFLQRVSLDRSRKKKNRRSVTDRKFKDLEEVDPKKKKKCRREISKKKKN